MELLAETAKVRTSWFWFHGFNYNTTPGSRTIFSVDATDTIKAGYAFCLDPEAYTDEATLPTDATTGVKMTIKGKSTARYVRNVTKPATGILNLFAGVVVNAEGGIPPAGLKPSLDRGLGGYRGGIWLELAYSAEAVPALILGDMSSNGYGELLGPVNAQWYLGIIALGTNGANLPQIVANPLIRTNVAAAAVNPVRLGALGQAYCN